MSDMVLVPREPTEAMLRAGTAGRKAVESILAEPNTRATWEAMIDAALQPEGDVGDLAKKIEEIANHWKGANGGVYTIRAMALELARELSPLLHGAPQPEGDVGDLAQSDLRELLLALGMGDHARPQSPHEVFQEALGVLRGRLAPMTPGYTLRRERDEALHQASLHVITIQIVEEQREQYREKMKGARAALAASKAENARLREALRRVERALGGSDD